MSDILAGNPPRIAVRPSTGWRRVASDSEADVWATTASLLNLARFEPTVDPLSFPSAAATERGLRRTDHAAFAVFEKSVNSVRVECRSRAADRLYVGLDRGGVEIAAGIEHATKARSAPLSSRFLSIWLANAVRFGNFDFFLGCSPFEEIYLVTRGLQVSLDLATGVSTTEFISEGAERSPYAAATLQEAVENCKSALDDAIAVATRGSDVVAECSGGIDSGLTAVLAKRIAGDRFRGGIFADLPYHEFRLERQFAQRVAAHGGFPLLPSDSRLFMYWGALQRGRMSGLAPEPSLLLPFWGQALAADDLVRDRPAPTILTGQGGDLLFQERDHPYSLGDPPDWISRSRWSMVAEEIDRIDGWIGASHRAASGYGFDNLWTSRSLGTLHEGAIYYAPLTARNVIDSVLDLRHHLAEVNHADGTIHTGIQKRVAHAAFAECLPDAIWSRRWKVNFVGNFYRFWLTRGQEFVRLAERMHPALEALELPPKPVIRHVREMAEGKHSADRLLNALMAYLYWLDLYKKG